MCVCVCLSVCLSVYLYVCVYVYFFFTWLFRGTYVSIDFDVKVCKRLFTDM